MCVWGGLTCSQSQPEGMAVLDLEGVVPHVENAARRVHGAREGGRGGEDEGGGGQRGVPRVRDRRHGEEDVGEQPAAEGRPARAREGQRRRRRGGEGDALAYQRAADA